MKNFKIKLLHRINLWLQNKLFIMEVRKMNSNAVCDIQEIQKILEPLMEDYIKIHDLSKSKWVSEDGASRWLWASPDDYRLHRNPPKHFYALKEYMKGSVKR